MACELPKDEFGVCEDPDCFPCKLRSIQISPYATPTRQSHRPSPPPRGNQNSWEKGIVTDSRGMPQLDSKGEPMSVKAFGEQRSQIEEHKRKLRQTAANPS